MNICLARRIGAAFDSVEKKPGQNSESKGQTRARKESIKRI